MATYTQEFLDNLPSVDYSLSYATEDHIKFRLFTKSKEENGTVLNKANITNTLFNRNVPTKVFIHGYAENSNTPWYKLLKDGYFRTSDHNIIQIDWMAAQKKYFASCTTLKFLGELTADLLISSEIPHDHIHLIGFSLGAHMCGLAGKHILKQTGRKIDRITALEPARPCFHKVGSDKRISYQDANFVDAYHTDIGWLTLTEAIAHVDFYPNGGKNQPGCPPHEVNQYANHIIGPFYFIQSLHKNINVRRARLLASENKVEVLDGAEEEGVFFGDRVSRFARGVFHVNIKNEISPTNLYP